MVPSVDLEMMVWPSLVKATSVTDPLCPNKVIMRAGQSSSLVSTRACSLGIYDDACLATRLLVGASTASCSAALQCFLVAPMLALLALEKQLGHLLGVLDQVPSVRLQPP